MTKDTRSGDRHLYKSIGVRLGPDWARVEKYAIDHGMFSRDESPNRNLVVRMAVAEFLDRHESQQGENNG